MRLRYLNINGLNRSKLLYIEKLIESSSEEIFIIAEHWFSEYKKLSESRFFVCSSPQPTGRRIGHQNGGLALLCTHNLRHAINVVELMEFFIIFRIDTEKIMAIYLPPRLSTNDISDLLEDKILGLSYVVGDTNVRFGSQLADKRTWNLDRGELLSQLLGKYGLSL
jgi:hypothetical protein